MSRAEWTLRFGAAADASVRLFCFSHIGGGASSFRLWPAELPPQVGLRAVQLPGRENRLAEEPIRRMEELVEALRAGLDEELDPPFAFFGHSLGALVAFELARRLRETGSPLPSHLFVSAHRAPQLPEGTAPASGSDDDLL
jgi:medium-chain acyl-[acyl-carrier-protein] hydrolase